MGRFKS